MKNLINVTIILLSISLSLSAQSLNVRGISDSDGVLLRWAPDNPALWKEGNEEGYKILRKTIAFQDVPYTIEQLIKSKITLDSTIVVLSSNAFDQLDIDSLGPIAGQLIHDESHQPVISANYSLADAVAYKDYVESKFVFSLLLADQSFELAKAQALAFEDNTAEIDYTYQYTIMMNGDSTTSAGTVTIKHSESATMQAPQEVQGEGSNLAAKLSWEIKSTSKLYNLYNIQRSRDNTNFETVNSKPFTFISESEDDPKYAFYSDSIPDNTNTYYYRIIGLSPFGIESSPSDTVMVKGVPAKLDITMTIDSLHEVTEGDLRIDWRSIPNSLTSDLSHFDIYIKESVDALETKLNASPIAPNERYYDRMNAPSDAYYRLEATDRNGHVYSSLSFAGQVVDKTPPTAPIISSGKILRDGTVVLAWQDNIEADLMGYKVFYSNVKNGEYSTTETEVQRDTFQIGSINTDMDTDSIFYKVAAYDNRYNRSEFSEIISLERPDDVAPGNPVIAQILARPEGIRISWLLSHSSDVSLYTLQRKTTEATAWNDVLSFTPAEAPSTLPIAPEEEYASQYIDEEDLQLRYYNYRLVAKDNFDNQATSPIKTIKPYDDLIRGEIREYVAYIPQGQGLTNTLSANTGGTFDTDGDEITNVINNTVKLQWQYKNTNQSTLKEFKIYMQEVKPGISPTDPLLENVPYMLVNTISVRKAETIALTQGYGGYMYLHDLARTPGFKYNFKIMAYHTDGGFSEFTDSVAVPH